MQRSSCHVLLLPQYFAWRLCDVMASEVTSLGCHSDLWRPLERAYSRLAVERGYARLPGLTTYMPWNEIDRGEIEHPLTFWLRDWQAAPA